MCSSYTQQTSKVVHLFNPNPRSFFPPPYHCLTSTQTPTFPRYLIASTTFLQHSIPSVPSSSYPNSKYLSLRQAFIAFHTFKHQDLAPISIHFQNSCILKQNIPSSLSDPFPIHHIIQEYFHSLRFNEKFTLIFILIYVCTEKPGG